MSFEIKPAVREKTHVLVSLAGPSGCGKTYSALLMARGLVGSSGKIGFIDTEAKRARHYADLTPFDVADMTPPLSWTATYPLIESLRSRLVVLTKGQFGR